MLSHLYLDESPSLFINPGMEMPPLTSKNSSPHKPQHAPSAPLTQNVLQILRTKLSTIGGQSFLQCCSSLVEFRPTQSTDGFKKGIKTFLFSEAFYHFIIRYYFNSYFYLRPLCWTKDHLALRQQCYRLLHNTVQVWKEHSLSIHPFRIPSFPCRVTGSWDLSPRGRLLPGHVASPSQSNIERNIQDTYTFSN